MEYDTLIESTCRNASFSALSQLSKLLIEDFPAVNLINTLIEI